MSTTASSSSQPHHLTKAKAISTSSKTPSVDCFKSSFVAIEVGPEKKAYTIHKDLLCFYSEYFRGAFEGSFKEASDKRLPLPEEDIATFEIFHGFLYTRTLTDTEGRAGADLKWLQIVNVWIFGDKYIIPSLQNLAMDVLFKKNAQQNTIPTSRIRYIYAKTMANSPLRRALVDLMTYTGNIGLLTRPEYVNRWTAESLADLAVAQYHAGLKSRKKSKMPRRNKCHYHVHTEGERC